MIFGGRAVSISDLEMAEVEAGHAQVIEASQVPGIWPIRTDGAIKFGEGPDLEALEDRERTRRNKTRRLCCTS